EGCKSTILCMWYYVAYTAGSLGWSLHSTIGLGSRVAGVANTLCSWCDDRTFCKFINFNNSFVLEAQKKKQK
ncbi:Hypothetical predicted protein, partial [Paramuricea clavata]